jgi:hypothetical protein
VVSAEQVGAQSDLRFEALSACCATAEGGATVTDKDKVLIEGLMAKAQENLVADDCLMPVAFLLHKDDSLGIVGMQFDNDEQKYASCQTLSQIAAVKHCQKLLLVTDAWVSVVSKKQYENEPHRKASAYPQRKECIVGNLILPDGETVASAMIIYERLGKKRFKFEALKLNEYDAVVQNLIPRWDGKKVGVQ